MRRIAIALIALLCVSVGASAQTTTYPTRVYPNTGPCTLTSTYCAFPVPVWVPNGDATAPALGPSSTPGTGIFFSPTNIRWTIGGVQRGQLGSDAISLGGSLDVVFSREAANVSGRKNGNADQADRLFGANGGYWEKGVISELLTIAAAATTDTTGNLLPANAVIEAVVVRVTTVIPTAATFTVGDATTAARFATGVAVAAGTTAVGLLHRHPDVAAAAGPVQATAAKIRITPNASPAAATGVIRVEVFYSQFVAPTS